MLVYVRARCRYWCSNERNWLIALNRYRAVLEVHCRSGARFLAVCIGPRNSACWVGSSATKLFGSCALAAAVAIDDAFMSLSVSRWMFFRIFFAAIVSTLYIYRTHFPLAFDLSQKSVCNPPASCPSTQGPWQRSAAAAQVVCRTHAAPLSQIRRSRDPMTQPERVLERYYHIMFDTVCLVWYIPAPRPGSSFHLDLGKTSVLIYCCGVRCVAAT